MTQTTPENIYQDRYLTEGESTITTEDGRVWTARSVQNLDAAQKAIRAQRDQAQLALDLLRGQIHLLDCGTP